DHGLSGEGWGEGDFSISPGTPGAELAGQSQSALGDDVLLHFHRAAAVASAEGEPASRSVAVGDRMRRVLQQLAVHAVDERLRLGQPAGRFLAEYRRLRRLHIRYAAVSLDVEDAEGEPPADPRVLVGEEEALADVWLSGEPLPVPAMRPGVFQQLLYFP